MRYVVVFADAHLWLHCREAESGRSGARGDIKEEKGLFLAGEFLEDLPESENGFVFFVVIVVDGIVSQFLNAEVRIVARDDSIQLLVAEHSQPFRLHHFQETSSEKSSLFFDLLVALVVSVVHDELHLVFAI